MKCKCQKIGRIRILLPTMCSCLYLRNKSWKSECVLSFNMDWRILVFYPEPVVSMIYFDSDMSKSTNTVVYFDRKTVIYI